MHDHDRQPSAPTRPGPLCGWRRAAAVLAVIGLGSAAWAQITPASAPGPQPSASLPMIDVLSSSEWLDLTFSQQRALRPLETSWSSIDEAQRRKWLSLSRNYASLSTDDQVRLHSRMREWAALSPKERIQARLNFAETKKLAVDEKRAKWEAYQALSQEERRRLAASAPTRPPGAAPAIKPMPQKLVSPPAPAVSAPHPPDTAAKGRIFVPDRVDPRTLLPRPEFRSQP